MLIEWIIRWVLISLFTAVALPRFQSYLHTTMQQPILQELEAVERQLHTAVGERNTPGSLTAMEEWPHLSSSQAPLPLIHVAPSVSARLLASSSTFTTR
ncbi:MAG: hypothetical protein HYZ81_17140 [Nitrospinae bacterium]|nr:hypothetical protein [Nitrospinota bacterium]